MNHIQQGEIPLPSVDGSFTPLEGLEFHRDNNFDEPMYVFSDDRSSEPTKVCYGEFSRACDRLAHVIRPGRAGDDGRVVAIICVTDALVYQAVLIGIMKAGLVPFPISHRLTPQAVIDLLEKTSCHDLVTTPATVNDLLGGIKQELQLNHSNYELRIDEIPSLDYLFPKLGREVASDPFEPYPSSPQHPDLAEVFLYLHSSGSTGLPKAIPQTYRLVIQWAGFASDLRAVKNPRLRFAVFVLPPFHAFGFAMHTLVCVYHGLAIAIYPPVKPSNPFPITPSPDNALDHMRRTKCTGLAIVPAYLHTWSHSEEAVKCLSTLDHILYAGGPVSTKVGDSLVAAGANLRSVYGGTEFAAPTKFYTDRSRVEDWEWMEISDRANVEWVDQGDGTYECHFLTCATHHPVVLNRSDKRGYATSDLFVKHPTNDKLWRIVGRLDDVIIHSSGEKTVPNPMEDIILTSPIIQGAIMFGRGHDHAGVLIEPRADWNIDVKDEKALANLRNRIWPIVEEANKVAQNYSRIFKEMILICSSDKPLPRTGKGTVMRKAALRDYNEEIEALYRDITVSAGTEYVKPPHEWEASTVEHWLLKQVEHIHPQTPISVTQDLFEQGLDSLSVTFLRVRILSAMRTSKLPAGAISSISQNTIYAHPTVGKLAQCISDLAKNSPQVKTQEGRVKNIDTMIEEYSAGLSPVVKNTEVPVEEGLASVVLLTGSTGHLGSHLLSDLLKNDAVQRVYAYNRPGSPSIEQRQYNRFKDGGLDVNLLKSEKLRFIQGELSDKDLGIGAELYAELQRSVNLIIHNAWKLDFNLSLESFESHVRGARNLIDFATRGPHASTLRFLFTSSIGSAQSWDRLQGPYPEEVVRDARFAVGNGYGESKYVAERVLERSGLRACSLRIGQLTGSVGHGAWATTDWFPILVKSSITLGGFPSSPGMASWIPMGAVAQAILDLAYLKENASFAVNLVHPRPVSWNFVIEAVRDGVAKVSNIDSAQLPLIPFKEWMNRLLTRSREPKPEDFEKIPAMKIVDFFQDMAKGDQGFEKGDVNMEFSGLPSFNTKKAQKLSATMQSVPPLRMEDVNSWVAYWKDVSFL